MGRRGDLGRNDEMNVGIWIRVSTEDQARGESPRHHETRARMYAELKNWQVIELYDLSGVSGKDVMQHPEAKRMLEDVQKGHIKSLIFSKLARLARNTKQLLEISDHFQKFDACLVSLEESIDTSSPAGRLLYTVIGALAQWEREEISARVAASIPVRAKLGKNTGGKGPFGYHWVEGKLIPNPVEAPIIKRAYELFLENHNLLATSKILNGEGYARKFRHVSLKRLLADPVYKGIRRANYAKSLGDKKHWVLKPEEEWVYFNVEPLVSEEDWDLANKAFAENERRHGKKRVPKTSSYLFSGLLKCAKCGEKMYVMPYPYMKTPRYVCRNCRDAKINEDVLITHFVEALKKIAISPEQLGSEKDLEQEIKDKQELIEVLKKEQKEIGRKVDKLVELYEDSAIDREGFRERYAALKERKDNLIVQIPRLQAEIDFIKTNEIARSYIIERATTLAALWVDLSYEAQKDIVRELAEQIDVGDDSLNFVLYHIPSSFDVVEKGVHNNRDSWPPPA